jgi:hypothetical protein
MHVQDATTSLSLHRITHDKNITLNQQVVSSYRSLLYFMHNGRYKMHAQAGFVKLNTLCVSDLSSISIDLSMIFLIHNSLLLCPSLWIIKKCQNAVLFLVIKHNIHRKLYEHCAWLSVYLLPHHIYIILDMWMILLY